MSRPLVKSRCARTRRGDRVRGARRASCPRRCRSRRKQRTFLARPRPEIDRRRRLPRATRASSRPGRLVPRMPSSRSSASRTRARRPSRARARASAIARNAVDHPRRPSHPSPRLAPRRPPPSSPLERPLSPRPRPSPDLNQIFPTLATTTPKQVGVLRSALLRLRSRGRDGREPGRVVRDRAHERLIHARARRREDARARARGVASR